MHLRTRIYILVLFYLDVSDAVRVVKFSLSDGSFPEKGRDISMSCDFEITSNDGIQTLNILKGEDTLASCILYEGGNLQCKQAGLPTRYTFTNNPPSVIISITDLQISDAGNWYCGFQTTGNTLYTLLVYSSPVSIVWSGSSGPGDLSIKGVDFACRTSNCVYPAPGNIQWFYKKEDSWLPYQNTSTSPSQSTCRGSEKIYSSTLSLAKNTVWPLQPTNTDVTVKFQCRLNFPTLQSHLVSADSNNVRYAVQVTSATIFHGITVAKNPMYLLSRESTTLTCHTSISRPAAVIVWYIGSKEKQRSSSNNFTFHPEINDNNAEIYCKAFNIQPESQAVNSTELKLYIQDRTTVKSFYIGQNESQTNATFKEHDVGIELNCIVEGKPASSIDVIFDGNILITSSNTNILSYSFQDVTCNDGGDYICRSTDTFEQTTSKLVSLAVECAPRPLRQILHNITSDLGVPVKLSFTVIAYPKPGPRGFTWYKEDRSVWISLLSNKDFKIASSGLETSLTIRNVSREFFGKYRVTVTNGIDSYEQILYLSGKGKISQASCKCTCTERSSVTLLVLSIILGVVCFLVVGYSAGVTIMYRRNINKKCPTSTNKTRTKSSNVNASANSERTAGHVYDDASTNEDSSKQYTELAHYSNEQTTYERLEA